MWTSSCLVTHILQNIFLLMWMFVALYSILIQRCQNCSWENVHCTKIQRYFFKSRSWRHFYQGRCWPNGCPKQDFFFLSESDETYGQVWWPILWSHALHLTHPFILRRPGAVGGSVLCSRVSPQSWYWRWREHCTFTPPTYNSCRTWNSNSQPLDYESDSLPLGHDFPLLYPLP